MRADRVVSFVASYTETATASSDRRRLQRLLGDGQVVAGPVALHRHTSGNVAVAGTTGAAMLAPALILEDAALVVGLLVPELLLSSAMAFGVDTTVKGLIRHHEQRRLGADVGEFLAPGRSAVAVLAISERVDALCRALSRSDKTVEIPVDPSDQRALRSALTDARRQAVDPHSRKTGAVALFDHGTRRCAEPGVG